MRGSLVLGDGGTNAVDVREVAQNRCGQERQASSIVQQSTVTVLTRGSAKCSPADHDALRTS
jgi:hypothetical protein